MNTGRVVEGVHKALRDIGLCETTRYLFGFGLMHLIIDTRLP